MMTVDPIKTAELAAVEAIKDLRNMAASCGMTSTVMQLNFLAESVRTQAKRIEREAAARSVNDD